MERRRRTIPAALARKIDRVFSRWGNRSTPGVALAVVREGHYEYRRCFGMADLEHGIPISPSTVFDLGSVSKQFTAACVAILSQRGKLSLDDGITKYLPELPRFDPTVTLRHLLDHTGGLRNMYVVMALMGRGGGIPPFDWGDTVMPFPQEFRVLCRQKGVDFPAGDRWDYSNMGYHLLAEVVKRVSGKSLRKFADEAIFRPLGMRHTHFHDDPGEVVPNRARGYAVRKGGGFRIWEQPSGDPGASGLNSTLDDMLKWAANFSRNRLGKPGLMDIMLTPARLNDGTVQGYGMGLIQRVRRGARWTGHNGWYTGYVSCFVHYPEHRFSVVFLRNVAEDVAEGAAALAAAEQVADICLSDVLRDGPEGKPPASVVPPVPIRVEPGSLARFAGVYRSAEGESCSIYNAGTMLLSRLGREGWAELDPVGESDFLVLGKNPPERAVFAGRTGKGPLRLRWIRAGTTVREMRRRDSMDPAPAVKAGEYAGNYFNGELETMLEVSARGNGLQMRGIGQAGEPWDALPIEKDVFQGGRARLSFSRGGSGRIDGFDLQYNLTRLRWSRAVKPA